MVKLGYAFAYRHYSEEYVHEEELAAKLRIGVHTCEGLQKPWDYAKKNVLNPKQKNFHQRRKIFLPNSLASKQNKGVTLKI
ncbi:MAG: hypothetical protein K0R63_812 [Rickettsiales bacterium]|nr:hypothetical protein [Rickettsiales bacterium]